MNEENELHEPEETTFEWIEGVEDEQPETDSETEPEEATADEQDEVEPDSSEEEEEEKPEEEGLTDDTDIDLGEDKKPVKLKELKDGYLRQADYTKKTQEVARQREEIDREKEEMKPIKEWAEYIESNPYLFHQIDNAIKEWNNTGVLPVEDIVANAGVSKYVNHLMSENSRLQKELESVTGEYQTTKFTTEMNTLASELKEEYGELVTDEYMTTLQNEAKEHGYSAEVAKKIAEGELAKKKLHQEHKDTKKMQRETEAKTVQNMREKKKKMPPQPKQTAQRPDTSTEKIEEWEDVFGA